MKVAIVGVGVAEIGVLREVVKHQKFHSDLEITVSGKILLEK